MAKIKIRHLVQRGNSYYWQPSSKLRLLGWKCRKLSDTLEAAIAEAEKINDELDKWRLGKTEISTVPVVNSLSSLITSYKNSKQYRKIGEKTREGYDFALKLIDKWGGQVPLEAITRKAVQDFWEALAKKSEWKANAVIRVLRLLLNYAVFMGELQVNPAARPGLVEIDQRDVVWSPEEVQWFVEKADNMGYFNVGTAVMLSCFLAQREGDILKLDWNKYINGAFTIRQHKTNAYICVPVHPLLKDRLDLYAHHNGYIVRSDYTGGNYTKDAFVKYFAKIRSEVCKEHPAMSRLKFLDLRRTAIVRLAEAGCTEAQISAVSGHKIDTCRRILEVYLPRNSKMAQAAIEKYSTYLPAA